MAKHLTLVSNNPYIGGGSANGGEPPSGDELDARVAKLENGFSDMRVTMARVEEKLNNLATKSDMIAINTALGGVKSDLSGLSSKVGTLPSTWNIIGIFAAMMGLFLGGGGIVLTIIRMMPAP